ncbi:MFS transporter [Chloroflexus sp. MS-G]|uniref:MFS transporter n=1 Tax=Chloroflexus sp. MS-G TaxID=1521187 RepID=UPI0004DED711|nr:MFS transporter [Chloroflexus sp. MS-G]
MPLNELQSVVPTRTLGLRENWSQFTLLVLVNAFVGGMVGIERTVLPLLAGAEFGLASHLSTLHFIVSFGLVKAITNLFAGGISERIGRKRTLIAGWLSGLPVPLIIMFAPDWSWVVFANVLLGINQGLCWSTTVIMKIDLVGPTRRGLAMGLNEAAGYLAVALAALGAGYLAAVTSLRPEPFWLGIIFVLAGLLISVFFVHETKDFVALEVHQHRRTTSTTFQPETFTRVFLLTSWRNRNLFAVSQAGLINNLNDGMAWGLFPVFFAMVGLSLSEVGILVAIYPAVWGLLQLVTGAISDHIGRKKLIAGGMLIQAIAIWLLPTTNNFWEWVGASALLGVGTALVYPTLLAAIGDVAHPSWRATAVGVYRFWRDSGYVIGALLAGILADTLGISWSMWVIGALTFLSGVLVAVIMREQGAVM